jgi:hypothetical protein
MSPQAALWIASWSLSSGARSRDPLDRNGDDISAKETGSHLHQGALPTSDSAALKLWRL